jgi:ferrochelatase
MADKKQPGVLLVNLGSPASTTVEDVRSYLGEFLMDEFILDYPAWLRWLVVHAFILPRRPARSAAAYRSIWWEDGSPLIVLSQRQQALLQAQLDCPVALAMRYGSPSIEQGIEQLLRRGVRRILLVPLYPHHALSTRASVEAAVRTTLTRLSPSTALSVLPPFYDEPVYIQALVESAREYLAWDYDHVLFSYHGIPERHVRKSDPTKLHCLKVEDCCHTPSKAHATCYRHQAFRTAELFTRQAGIPESKYSIAFQSRLGSEAWLRPATAETLAGLAQRGVRRLLVMCPSFVTDCLETLEEIELRGRETFLSNGGEEFRMIPCLNTHPRWIGALAELCRRALGE